MNFSLFLDAWIEWQSHDIMVVTYTRSELSAVGTTLSLMIHEETANNNPNNEAYSSYSSHVNSGKNLADKLKTIFQRVLLNPCNNS